MRLGASAYLTTLCQALQDRHRILQLHRGASSCHKVSHKCQALGLSMATLYCACLGGCTEVWLRPFSLHNPDQGIHDSLGGAAAALEGLSWRHHKDAGGVCQVRLCSIPGLQGLLQYLQHSTCMNAESCQPTRQTVTHRVLM